MIFRNHSRLYIVLLIGMFIFAACSSGGGDDEDIQLPTRVDSENGSAIEDTSEEGNMGVTPTAPSTAPEGRPTLPPSWTPTVSPTSTITPTVAASPTQEVISTPVGCGTFRVDRENSTTEFNLGESPTIAWTRVDGASFYRIRLFDATQNEITLDPLSSVGTSLEINDEYFPAVGRYGWVVEPIGADGIQMCTGMGESFIVNE